MLNPASLLIALTLTLALPLVARADNRPEAFLHADGTLLRNRLGQPVHLRGANLGGWLEWQAWMCPIDTSKTLRDANPGHNGYNFEVRNLLTSRFGQLTARQLLDTYQDAWITDRDLDNIKSLRLNVVRLTLAYDTLLHLDGSWRDDAFKRIDWLVAAAWQRGLYTILDYHAFLPPSANQDGSAAGYWSNDAQKAETVRIWTRLAEHFKGNPAIAMYDLLNEPNNSQPKGQPAPKSSVVCDLYDQLYHAIRKVDPDHLIAMEGTWNWQTLRDPLQAGYRNVVYSFHWYYFGSKTTADRNQATDHDIQSILKMQKLWNVPVFIGEFNLFGDQPAWKYAIQQYDQHRLHWTIWTYKNTASGSNSWGLYTTLPHKAPPTPNLLTDSPQSIQQAWKSWITTPQSVAPNPLFLPLLTPPNP